MLSVPPAEAEWPRQPGSYVLWLSVAAPLTFEAGRLGQIALPAGLYAYVGSARGPGGLRGRLARHGRAQKRLHWHIDHLTRRAPIIGVYWEVTELPAECRWVQRLLQLPGASAPVRGFGSSDCRCGCPAHLIRLPDDLQNTACQALAEVPGTPVRLSL
ncbi:MAG: GIY-YIG nuclease family protein [Anaerolineae bacterium]|nr:GIY-YIG nuclease family protein [Anaerolineae bacterium]